MCSLTVDGLHYVKSSSSLSALEKNLTREQSIEHLKVVALTTKLEVQQCQLRYWVGSSKPAFRPHRPPSWHPTRSLPHVTTRADSGHKLALLGHVLPVEGGQRTDSPGERRRHCMGIIFSYPTERNVCWQGGNLSDQIISPFWNHNITLAQTAPGSLIPGLMTDIEDRLK